MPLLPKFTSSFGKGSDHEKKYGYIIIPVIVPNDVTPEQALSDNERFKVVWTILNALRSHDENFNAHVNQINLNKKRPPKITVGGVPHGTYSIGQNNSDGDDAVQLSNEEVNRQLNLQFGELQEKRSDKNKIMLESQMFRVIIQKKWNGKEKTFLLSAFDLRKKPR